MTAQKSTEPRTILLHKVPHRLSVHFEVVRTSVFYVPRHTQWLQLKAYNGYFKGRNYGHNGNNGNVSYLKDYGLQVDKYTADIKYTAVDTCICIVTYISIMNLHHPYIVN